MKELFNTLSNVSKFFTEKHFIYRGVEKPSSKDIKNPAADKPFSINDLEKAHREIEASIKGSGEQIELFRYGMAQGHRRIENNIIDAKHQRFAAEINEKIYGNPYQQNLIDAPNPYVYRIAKDQFVIDFETEGEFDHSADIGTVKLGDILNEKAEVVIIKSNLGDTDDILVVRKKGSNDYFDSKTGKDIPAPNNGMRIELPDSPWYMSRLVKLANKNMANIGKKMEGGR